MRATIFAIAILLAGCHDKAADPLENVAVPASGVPAPKDASASPSFDCGRADGQAQELVCNDANLAAMDREMARIYALAQKDRELTPELVAELGAMQRGWIKGRDDCWKGDDLRQCVLTSYAMRIHELRQSSQNARKDESGAISVGPVAYACEGIDAPVSATFVNTDPGSVYLAWSDQRMALDRAPSGSGARYEGRWNGENWMLWIKGQAATFTIPGKGDLACREVSIG